MKVELWAARIEAVRKCAERGLTKAATARECDITSATVFRYVWEWWTIWQMSGRWEERGRGHGYMMCRKGDVGPYALGNVVIATGDFNAAIQPNNPYRKGHPQFNEMMERLAAQRQSRAAA